MTMTDERPEGSNTSGNESLHDVIAMSRRSALARGLGAGALAFIGAGKTLSAAPATAQIASRSALGFAAVPTSDADSLVVPSGYTAEPLIPWGQPLFSNGPTWKKDASNTAAEQEQQIGMHHDGMHYFPLAPGHEGNHRGLLVVNHEYVDAVLLYTDGATVMTQEKVDKALAAHGVSVIEVAVVNGKWQAVDGPYNRRITGNTPMSFSGPVTESHPALQSELGLSPRGTLNNCANGFTPWNTYLTCEENWNGYFGTSDTTWTASAAEARYGISANGAGYRWHTVDPRFDVAKNRKELNRFGWVVEVDPFNPRSTPVKRTALGRIKHENATFAQARGHAVIYTGDDENGDYFYKFVSAEPWRSVTKGWFNTNGPRRSPLDEGVLYVAKFEPNGTGRWLPLVFGQGPLTPANGWTDQADVLIRTQQAADALGATKMDRPEWCAVHPRTQNVYLTLTNGSGWEAPSSPNPRAPNPYGHILEISHAGGDHTADTMRWSVYILAGDPAFDASVRLDASNIFGSPDGIYIDRDGRMWVQTDISNGSQNRTNYVNIKNNMMLAVDPDNAEIKRFLTGPRGAEITGVSMTPDQRTMFINVQHPGESTAAWGVPTPANPRAVSNWPDFDPAGRPRAATVVIRKADGGKIGT
ncbi:MAG: PhoX family phosphatase [Rhodospirillaceae bacterium]